MIRAIYRTDALSFLFPSPLELSNEAITRDLPSRRSFFSPEIFLEHWVPLRGRRRTWISDDGGRIGSLVSVKSGASPQIWHVDYLQASDEEHCYALLDFVGRAAAKRGVRKIFLNLSINSSVVDAARRAGFSSYNRYFTYRYDGRSTPSLPPPPTGYDIRSRWQGDDWGLYTLYNSAVPLGVRNAEGMTFEEWHDSLECSTWFEHRAEFIVHRGDALAGWLRTSSAKGKGCFEIIFHQMEGGGLEWLVAYALNCLRGKRPVLCIVSASQWQLKGILENSGFDNIARFETMVRENIIRVEEPGFVPMQA
ncbi:MAG: hypothetical protein U9N44_06935 [Chloroflexota bacterium]|nr:hypothetical protein [Chloroflexota bacterium]